MPLDDLTLGFFRSRRLGPNLNNPNAILLHGLAKYAGAISALRSYHQHRANFMYGAQEALDMDIETGNIDALTNARHSYLIDTAPQLDILSKLNEEIEKKAKGVLDCRNAALYLALMDGSGTVFDNHGQIKGLLDRGIDVDFVAGFWFLSCLNGKAFECIYVDDGRSIKTFEHLDEPARNGLVAAVHKMRMNEVNSPFNAGINPNTDYFAIIAEPRYHRHDVKMLLPYSAPTSQ